MLDSFLDHDNPRLTIRHSEHHGIPFNTNRGAIHPTDKRRPRPRLPVPHQ